MLPRHTRLTLFCLLARRFLALLTFRASLAFSVLFYDLACISPPPGPAPGMANCEYLKSSRGTDVAFYDAVSGWGRLLECGR